MEQTFKLRQTGAELQAILDKCVELPTREELDAELASAYHKPEDGIPNEDLSEEVRTSLSKADTALQEAYEVINHADLSLLAGTYNINSIASIVRFDFLFFFRNLTLRRLEQSLAFFSFVHRTQLCFISLCFIS